MLGADLPTRAISLHAPWAWALLHAGKDVENRSPSFGRSYLGRVWIHVSRWPNKPSPLDPGSQRTPERKFRDEMVKMEDLATHLLAENELPGLVELDAMRGNIVGSVEITGYSRDSESIWFVPGSLAIKVSSPVALNNPVTAVGAVGLWSISADVLAQLKEGA